MCQAHARPQDSAYVLMVPTLQRKQIVKKVNLCDLSGSQCQDSPGAPSGEGAATAEAPDRVLPWHV